MSNHFDSPKFEFNPRAALLVGLILVVGGAAGVYFLGGLVSSAEVGLLRMVEWLSVVWIGVAAVGSICAAVGSVLVWILTAEKFESVYWSSALGFEPLLVLTRRLDQIFKPPRFSY